MESRGQDVSESKIRQQMQNDLERIQQQAMLARENMSLYHEEMRKGNDIAANDYLVAAKSAEAEANSLRSELEKLGDQMRETWLTKPIDDYLDKLQ